MARARRPRAAEKSGDRELEISPCELVGAHTDRSAGKRHCDFGNPAFPLGQQFVKLRNRVRDGFRRYVKNGVFGKSGNFGRCGYSLELPIRQDREIGNSRNRNSTYETRRRTYDYRSRSLLTSEITGPVGWVGGWGRSDPGNRAISA